MKFKVSTFFILSSVLLNANFQCGETIENTNQGVHKLFENTTKVNIADIPSCESKEIKSIVYASRVNNVALDKEEGKYIKTGIESGVKICIDKEGDLVIYSYKNDLYKK